MQSVGYIKLAFTTLLTILLAAAIIIGGAVLINPLFTTEQDLRQQREWVASLRENPPPAVDEQSFAGFSLADASSIKFNGIQSLITHNSYKKNITKLNYYALRPFTNTENSNYEHDKLYNQLDNGARGVELDIRCGSKGFSVYHIPIKDSRSHSRDWELALQELKLWSDNNPNHLPISVLLEIKESAFDAPNLKKLDKSILDAMGRDKLITPSLLMGGNSTLRNVAANNDWITLDKAMGKFMFILHPCESVGKYIAMDYSMRSQIMVPMFTYEEYEQNTEGYADYYLLLKHDKLDVDTIQALVNSGYLVRTRMDEPCIHPEGNQQLAVRTGAQIISTDYEAGVIYPIVDYKAALTDGKTVVLVNNLIANGDLFLP